MILRTVWRFSNNRSCNPPVMSTGQGMRLSYAHEFASFECRAWCVGRRAGDHQILPASFLPVKPNLALQCDQRAVNADSTLSLPLPVASASPFTFCLIRLNRPLVPLSLPRSIHVVNSNATMNRDDGAAARKTKWIFSCLTWCPATTVVAL